MKRAHLVVVLLVCWCPAAVAAEPNFAGTWETTFGTLTLTQDGKQVKGAYSLGGGDCSLEGQVGKTRLTFRYKEPDAQGEGWF
jgi:alkaline phosphatase D